METELIREEENTTEKSIAEINRIKKAQAIAKIEQLNKEIDFSLFPAVNGFNVITLKFQVLLMQNEVRKANRGCARLKAKYQRLRDKLERIVTGKEEVASIVKHISSRKNKGNGKCECSGNGNKSNKEIYEDGNGLRVNK